MSVEWGGQQEAGDSMDGRYPGGGLVRKKVEALGNCPERWMYP